MVKGEKCAGFNFYWLNFSHYRFLKNKSSKTVDIGTLRLSQPCNVMVSVMAVMIEMIRLINKIFTNAISELKLRQIAQTRRAVMKKDNEPAKVFCPPKKFKVWQPQRLPPVSAAVSEITNNDTGR